MEIEEQVVHDQTCQDSLSSSSSRTFVWFYPLPKVAVFILIALFLTGLGVSLFILVVVHNASILVFFLLLFSLVLAFLIWNGRRDAALRLFLQSVPESDLREARDGQLVKVTGPVSCGSVSLESSYEKVSGCVYTSTLLYEYKPLVLPGLKIPLFCCRFWRISYSENISTDFYISDPKSGIRVSVRAGGGCGANIIPLVTQTTLIETHTTQHFNSLSLSLRKWFNDRNFSSPLCRFRLREGFIREGDIVTVFGLIRKQEDDEMVIVQPNQVVSSGCLTSALLLPMDFNGLIIFVTPSYPS